MNKITFVRRMIDRIKIDCGAVKHIEVLYTFILRQNTLIRRIFPERVLFTKSDGRRGTEDGSFDNELIIRIINPVLRPRSSVASTTCLPSSVLGPQSHQPPVQLTNSIGGLILTLCLLITFLLSTIPLTAQQLGDPFETYNRLLQADTTYIQKDGSSLLIRSIQNSHPWKKHTYYQQTPQSPLTFYTPQIRLSHNSKFPYGRNDGAMWQGRGLNTAVSFGGRFEYGPLEISFRPEFGYAENLDFDLAPDPPFFSFPYDLNEYAQGLARIDAPQRFGNESLSWFHPGQSWIRLSQWGAAAGVSTANMWVGPALYNPLTLSNNAPGFFHAFLETDGPVQTPIGKFESRIFWGGLQESDFFDYDPSNNLRYTTGLSFSYSPSVVPGLHLGFSRTFYENYPDDGLSAGYILRTFQPFTEERFAREQSIDVTNQSTPQVLIGDVAERMLTFFGRWVLPEDGFEVWFEWGRNDNSFDKRNIFTERVNTRSYVLGFLKRFDLTGSRWITLDYEMTQLENHEYITSNNYPVWYESLVMKQGFTHQGQVVGAGIGPGSNSQQARVNYYDHWGLVGISGARIMNNNDRLFRHYEHITGNQPLIGPRPHWENQVPQQAPIYDLHDTEYRLGLHGLYFLPHNLELQADINIGFFYNRNNFYENDVRNVNTMLTLRYQLDGFLR